MQNYGITFNKALHSWHGQKFIKSYNYFPFLDKQNVHLDTQNFAKQPKIFHKQKVLRIIQSQKLKT